jgi:hypothetical protein
MREHPEAIRSTQVTRLLGKIRIKGQSAGNQILHYSNKVGSSETTRGTLSDNNFSSLNLDLMFKYWFIGFTEGNGSFIVNKTGYLEFKVTQSSVDAQILFYIKKQLKFGSVSKQCKTSNTHHFRVRNQEDIFKLIHIFNGNLLTENSQQQFKSWLAAFNQKYDKKIRYTQNNSDVTLSNAWLAGFSDAEGCFTASANTRSEAYTQVQVRYILLQKEEKKLMSEIAKIFDSRISYLKSYDGYNITNMTVNLSKLTKVISYFKKYPLKTKKHIDYLNWLKVYSLVINKEHFTKTGLNKIKNLINKINKKS